MPIGCLYCTNFISTNKEHIGIIHGNFDLDDKSHSYNLIGPNREHIGIIRGNFWAKRNVTFV